MYSDSEYKDFLIDLIKSCGNIAEECLYVGVLAGGSNTSYVVNRNEWLAGEINKEVDSSKKKRSFPTDMKYGLCYDIAVTESARLCFARIMVSIADKTKIRPICFDAIFSTREIAIECFWFLFEDESELDYASKVVLDLESKIVSELDAIYERCAIEVNDMSASKSIIN